MSDKSKQSAGFTVVSNDFIDYRLAELRTVAELQVAIRLLRFSNNGAAWPSITRLATDSKLSRGNVSKALKRLQACGFIVRTLPGKGPKQTTKYIISDSHSRATVDEALATHAQQTVAQERPKIATDAHANSHSSAAQQILRQEPSTKTTDNNHGGEAAVVGGGGVFELVGKKIGEEAIRRHGLPHCLRIVRLIDVKRDNGTAEKPKALAEYLLTLDAERVDFAELDEHLHAQEAEARRREEDQARADELAEARETLGSVPDEQKDAYRELLKLFYPGHRGGRDETQILTAGLVHRFPDGNAALADFLKQPRQLERARNGEMVETLTL